MQTSTLAKRLSRRAILYGGTLLAGGLLAACAQPTPTPEPAKPAPQPTPAAKAPEPTPAAKPPPKEVITIKYHARLGPDWAAFHTKQAPRFEQQNPGVKVVVDELPSAEMYTKIYAMTASKTVGDVVWTYANTTAEHVARGVIRPIDDLVTADKFDLAAFWPSATKALSLKGKLYGLPFVGHFGTVAFYYNEDLFKANGVPVPTVDWSLDDLLKGALTNTKAPDTWGFRTVAGQQEYTPFWLRTFGGDLFSPDGKKAQLTEPNSLAGLKWLYDLVNTAKVSPDLSGAQMYETFMAGKLACYNGTTGTVGVLSTSAKPSFKWGAMVAPKGPTGKRGSQVGIAGLCVTALSKYPEVAFQLVKFYTSQEMGVEGTFSAGSPNARSDVWNSPRLAELHPLFKQITGTLGEPGPWYYPANARTDEAMTVLRNTLDAVWLKKVPFEEGIKQAEKDLQAVLDKPDV